MEEKKIILSYYFKSIITSSIFYAIITFFLNSIRETASLWVVYPLIAIQLYLYFIIFFSLWKWLVVYGFRKVIAVIFSIMLAVAGRVENWEIVIIPLIILVLLVLYKINLIFSLKGKKLLNFSYINLWVENEGELLKYLILRTHKGEFILENISYRFLSGGSFIDKWHHFVFKKTIKTKIKYVYHALFELHLFDFDSIEKFIDKDRDSVWDKLLNLIIIRVVTDYSKSDITKTNKQIFNLIAAYFTYEVKNRFNESEEITELKNQKNEIEINMDLLLSQAYFKNNKGQFKND